MASLFKSSFPLIRTQADMEAAIHRFGMLPFFRWNPKGISIQEMSAPGYLFNETEGGCWEWKGPIIRNLNVAYGKFFRNKAGFVSSELLSDFLNVRRAYNPLKVDSTEEMLLEIILANGPITSTELKANINGLTSLHRGPEDLKNIDNDIKSKRLSLEGPLQRLQMAGRILIADFRYKKSRSGENYGWGVALYATPEEIFGADAISSSRTAEESYSFLVEEVTKRWGERYREAIKLFVQNK